MDGYQHNPNVSGATYIQIPISDNTLPATLYISGISFSNLALTYNNVTIPVIDNYTVTVNYAEVNSIIVIAMNALEPVINDQLTKYVFEFINSTPSPAPAPTPT